MRTSRKKENLTLKLQWLQYFPTSNLLWINIKKKSKNNNKIREFIEQENRGQRPPESWFKLFLFAYQGRHTIEKNHKIMTSIHLSQAVKSSFGYNNSLKTSGNLLLSWENSALTYRVHIFPFKLTYLSYFEIESHFTF